MDRITRKELKQDRFREEVEHSVEYLGEHRRQLTLYGSIALAVVVVGAGIYWYVGRQHSARQAALREVIKTLDAAVGPGSNPGIKIFATQPEKDKAVDKALTDLAARYPGKDEGIVARYYQGVVASDKGNQPEAEKHFAAVAASGNDGYGSLARFALAEIYKSQGRTADAEKHLRYLAEHPTIFVSKEQAEISLGALLATSKPSEARKLLDPLRTSTRPTVSLAAVSESARITKN